MIKKLYFWASEQVHAPYAEWLFALLVFIEGFFFVPVNTLLTLFCLHNRSRAFYYAFVAVISSMFGSCTGYFLGAGLWRLWGNSLFSLISSHSFDAMVQQYHLYHHWAVLIGGLLPIPYKIITLSAGFCHLPLTSFLVCTFISRALRFFGIATFLYWYGEYILIMLDRYFYLLVLLGLCIMVGSWWLLPFLH